jgi:hypothetical protein
MSRLGIHRNQNQEKKHDFDSKTATCKQIKRTKPLPILLATDKMVL